jgi:GGDEF domain-containing protein
MTIDKPDNQAAEAARESREQRMAAVIDRIAQRGRENRVERENFGREEVETRMRNIPEGPARDKIRQREFRLAGYGAKPHEVYRELEEDIQTIETAYLDQRFSLKGEGGQDVKEASGLEGEGGDAEEAGEEERGERPLTENFGRDTVKTWIGDVLAEPEFKSEDLEKVARFMFDADGLKAVNDLTGSHKKGNEYLRRIAEVLADSSGEVGKMLEEMGIEEVIPMTAGHGDEYSVLVKSQEPLDQGKLDELLRLYERNITTVDVSDLVDFSKLGIRLAYDAKTMKDYEAMTEEEKAAFEARVAKDIPEGFKMRAKASGGVETLAGALRFVADEDLGERRLTGEEKSFEEIKNKLMGGLWEASDKRMMEDKTESKNRLKESADPNERALYQIFSRNIDQRMANRELQETRVELAEAQVDAERAFGYDRLVEQKQAELAELMGAKESLGDEVFMRQFMEISQKYDKMMLEIKDTRPA